MILKDAFLNKEPVKGITTTLKLTDIFLEARKEAFAHPTEFSSWAIY